MEAVVVLLTVEHGNYGAIGEVQPELKILMNKRPFQWWVSLQPWEQMGSPRANGRVEVEEDQALHPGAP